MHLFRRASRQFTIDIASVMLLKIFVLLVIFDTTACVSIDCLDLAKHKLCQKFRVGRVRSCYNDQNVNARYYEEDDCMSFSTDHPDTSESLFQSLPTFCGCIFIRCSTAFSKGAISKGLISKETWGLTSSTKTESFVRSDSFFRHNFSRPQSNKWLREVKLSSTQTPFTTYTFFFLFQTFKEWRSKLSKGSTNFCCGLNFILNFSRRRNRTNWPLNKTRLFMFFSVKIWQPHVLM